jgi:phosphoserine phosphatase RsbU/P
MNYFATMFFGVVDPDNGSVAYVNAGHPAAVILDATGKVQQRLKATGPAVGLFANAEFVIGQASLNPGDTLFIFSDGATDARDVAGKLFGEKRLIGLLEQPAPSAGALLERVEAALHAHMSTADPFDDITIMAVRRKTAT